MGYISAFLTLFWASLLFAQHPCSRLLDPSPENVKAEVRYHHSKGHNPRFKDAMPTYDQKTDFIFSIDPSGHADLFVGPLFVHTNFQAYHPREREFMPLGVHVHVKTREDLIQKMLASLEKNEQYSCWGFSCHHNALIFLQRHGIRLRDYIPLTGRSCTSKIMNEGFVDDNGQPFAQKIVVVQKDDTDYLAALTQSLRIHEAPRLGELLKSIGLFEETLTFLRSKGPVWASLAAVYETGNWGLLAPGGEELFHEFSGRLESELLLLAEEHEGSQPLLDAYALQKIDKATLNAGFKLALGRAFEKMGQAP